MKISYKVLKNYKNDLKSEEELAQDIIMHTAEVEDIMLKWENLKNVIIWEVKTCEKHPDSDKLNCTTVEVNWEIYSIVCWAPNVRAGIKVPVAMVGAQLTPEFKIAKTKIRGAVSEWMICSEDELWLIEERQEWILELPEDAPLWMSAREYFKIDDAILEIDNKAINHRPDLFSHIWILREIYAINWEKFDYKYSYRDFDWLNKIDIRNDIKNVVPRYIAVSVNNVKNIDSPNYIKDVLSSADIESKWLLVDVSNYSLYLYGQPTHCFDADKIKWTINIRYAKDWEKFIALDNNEYNLRNEDIVIADDEKILALGWVIWWKDSAVSNETKNIIIESAKFEQSIIRKTWKRLWIRTDSLNVFEKDIVNWLQIHWASLIVDEIEKNIDWIKVEWFTDLYDNLEKDIKIDYDIEFFNKLIWKTYSQEEIIKILDNLGIIKKWDKLIIPFWRKDLNFKADIAEEIARITWYNKIKSTIPNINLWAVTQNNTYKLKNDTRNFFTDKWFFDIYNYSFLNQDIMEKCLDNTDNLVAMKNALSEELTHLRWSLIPNLLDTIEKNQINFDNLKVFEIEKIFLKQKDNNIEEKLVISWLIKSNNIWYYETQEIISDFLKSIWIFKFDFATTNNMPSFAHKWRTAELIIRWKKVWYIWEISPKVLNNFDIKDRYWFFEIETWLIENALYSIKKYQEISNYQENNFDLNFVVPKELESNKIKSIIEKSDKELITKVDLIDIYENTEKLGENRSITFKIYIQSMEKTLDDKDKAVIIEKIIKNIEKIGWELR